MARYGIKGMIGGGAAPGGASTSTVGAWRDALARAGRQTELGTDLIVGLNVYIAPSLEQGIAEMTPSFEENMKMFAPIGFVRGLTDEQIRATEDPRRARAANLPTLRDAVQAGSWIIGPSEHIAAKIHEIQAQLPGLEEINVNLPVGTRQAVIIEQLERFATGVMPEFR
jgi:hypothetical protein